MITQPLTHPADLLTYCCLYAAPHLLHTRLIVLRVLTGLLCVMLGTMLVRYLVWAPIWLLTGSHFWILPNLMSETVSV